MTPRSNPANCGMTQFPQPCLDEEVSNQGRKGHLLSMHSGEAFHAERLGKQRRLLDRSPQHIHSKCVTPDYTGSDRLRVRSYLTL